MRQLSSSSGEFLTSTELQCDVSCSEGKLELLSCSIVCQLHDGERIVICTVSDRCCAILRTITSCTSQMRRHSVIFSQKSSGLRMNAFARAV